MRKIMLCIIEHYINEQNEKTKEGEKMTHNYEKLFKQYDKKKNALEKRKDKLERQYARARDNRLYYFSRMVEARTKKLKLPEVYGEKIVNEL